MRRAEAGGRESLFARSIFFVEMAVLLVVAACSALLLINANSVDDLLLSVFEETGEQRILDVSRDMEKSMSSLNESLVPFLDGQEADFAAVEHVLADEAGIRNIVRVESGDDALYIDAEGTGTGVLRRAEREFGLSPEAIATLMDSAPLNGFTSTTFRQASTGRSGIAVIEGLGAGAAILRVHFCTEPSMSAASRYLDNPAVFYIDSCGSVATGSRSGVPGEFDLSRLPSMPRTFFIEAEGGRYVCTWGVLDASDMSIALFFCDPTGAGGPTRVAASVVEVIVICLVALTTVLLAGRRWFTPVKSLEERSGAYQIEIEEKNELIRQDHLLRVMHGEAPAGEENGCLVVPGNVFVVVALVDSSGRLVDQAGFPLHVRSFFISRNSSASLTCHGGRVFMLVQLPPARVDDMEELFRSFLASLEERFDSTGSACACVSSTHTAEAEIHLAFLEAVEALEYSLLVEQTEDLVMYGSLEVQIARDAERRRLDEAEAAACEAIGELRLRDASAICSGFGTKVGGEGPLSLSGFRFTSLKGRMSVVMCECETLEVRQAELQRWATEIALCEDLEGLADVLACQAAELEEIQSSCPVEKRRFHEMIQSMELDYADPQFSATRLSRTHGVSLSTVTRLFRKYRGCTFLDCLHGIRIGKAKQLLAMTDGTIAEISEQVGYTSTMTMIRAFKRYEGMTPGKFREVHGGRK